MKRNVLSILCVLSFSCAAFGQILVKGKLVNKDGAIAGAIVRVKGTSRKTLTDIDGNFKIGVESRNDTLVFHFLNKPLEVVVRRVVWSELVKIQNSRIVDIFYISNETSIGYYGGFAYTPFGLYASTTFYKPLRFLEYTNFFGGFSTIFKENHTCMGGFSFRAKNRTISYRFDKIKFSRRGNLHLFNAHNLYSGNILAKALSINYGIGYQEFDNSAANISQKNWGVYLGLAKNFSKIDIHLSVGVSYFQNYWNWNVELSKDFRSPLSLQLAYNRINTIFNEVNLAVGYSFSKIPK